MRPHPSSAMFFEEKYRKSADPWDFASSEYERGRYQATCDALPGRRYHRAFEPGCSIGVLTARLAAFCDRVEAIEISPAAAELARLRCAHLPNVSVECASLSDRLPQGEFDLIVFSEIGYYFGESELRHILQELLDRLAIGGTLLATHWLGISEDHTLSGDRVHELLGAMPGRPRHEHAERHEGFRLDRWSRK